MKFHQHKISAFQAYALILTSVGLQNHVIVLPALLNEGGRDAWVSVIVNMFIYPLYILILYFIIRKLGSKSLFNFLKDQYGKTVSSGVAGLLTLILLLVNTVTFIDLIHWTHLSYLAQTPQGIIIISFIVISYFSARSGLPSIAIQNGILLPLIIILGFFVAIANMPNKDHSLLFPILQSGYEPLLKGMLYSGAGLVEILILLIFSHKLTTKVKLLPLQVLGVCLVGLTIGPTIGAIAEFGPENAGYMRFPAFEEWRLITLSKYIEHLDFFSIYQWLAGALIRISLLAYLITELWNISKKKTRDLTLIAVFSVLAIGAFTVRSDIDFVFLLRTYVLPVALVSFLACLVLIFVLVVFKKDGPK